MEFEQWNKVLVTEETRLYPDSVNGHRRRRMYAISALENPTQYNLNSLLHYYVAYDGRSVMLWAGFFYEAKTDVVFIENWLLTAYLAYK